MDGKEPSRTLCYKKYNWKVERHAQRREGGHLSTWSVLGLPACICTAGSSPGATGKSGKPRWKEGPDALFTLKVKNQWQSILSCGLVFIVRQSFPFIVGSVKNLDGHNWTLSFQICRLGSWAHYSGSACILKIPCLALGMQVHKIISFT